MAAMERHNNIESMKKDWKNKRLAVFFLLLFIVQTVFIVYMNLAASDKMIDYDGAKLYKHAIEMWENKTFFIQGWKNITTLELDCSLLMALPIYGLTQDIFLSFGISNIVCILGYTGVIYTIVKRRRQRKYALLAVDLVLIPYSVGMLEYFNMMFFNGGQYAVKVLVPLLFILLLTTPRGERKKWVNLAVMLIYGGLLFLTSLSSGIYVMFCGIFPLILLLFVDILMDGGLKKYSVYHLILCGETILFFLLGAFAGALAGSAARGDGMKLTKYADMQQNFLACLLGIFQTFNAVPGEDIVVMSFKGVLFLIRILLVILLLAVCVINMKKVLRPTREIEVKKYLACLFPWNLAVLIFIDTRYSSSNLTIEYRYYLIAMIPLLILLAIQLEEWLAGKNWMIHKAIVAFLCAALLVLCVGSDYLAFSKKESSLYVNDICQYIEGLDREVESVFFVPDEEAPEMCRFLDDSRTYCAYKAGEGLVVYDYYQSHIDRASHGDKNVILVYSWETPDMYLPQYIHSTYEKIGTVRWFDVYYSEINRFDGMSGIADAPASIDYFYSPGYECGENSVMNEQGRLEVQGNGEIAVKSPVFQAPEESCDIQMQYEVGHAEKGAASIGTLEVKQGDKTLYSADIPAKSGSVLLKGCSFEGEDVNINISVDKNVACILDYLKFVKKGKNTIVY